jgi:hypothetical protein
MTYFGGRLLGVARSANSGKVIRCRPKMHNLFGKRTPWLFSCKSVLNGSVTIEKITSHISTPQCVVVNNGIPLIRLEG